ncbi:MAG: hypothetical protein QXI43_00140 [Candidatus Nitrosocaldus sp.]
MNEQVQEAKAKYEHDIHIHSNIYTIMRENGFTPEFLLVLSSLSLKKVELATELFSHLPDLPFLLHNA